MAADLLPAVGIVVSPTEMAAAAAPSRGRAFHLLRSSSGSGVLAGFIISGASVIGLTRLPPVRVSPPAAGS